VGVEPWMGCEALMMIYGGLDSLDGEPQGGWIA